MSRMPRSRRAARRLAACRARHPSGRLLAERARLGLLRHLGERDSPRLREALGDQLGLDRLPPGGEPVSVGAVPARRGHPGAVTRTSGRGGQGADRGDAVLRHQLGLLRRRLQGGLRALQRPGDGLVPGAYGFHQGGALVVAGGQVGAVDGGDPLAGPERERKDLEEGVKKQRQRDIEDYEYKKTLERKKAQDKYEEEVRLAERKNQEKQEALEKGWKQREAALKEGEEEFARLQKEAEGFPARLQREAQTAAEHSRKETEAGFESSAE